MTADERLACHGLSILELGETFGNASGLYPTRGSAWTQLYGYKRRVQTHGVAELKDLLHAR